MSNWSRMTTMVRLTENKSHRNTLRASRILNFGNSYPTFISTRSSSLKLYSYCLAWLSAFGLWDLDPYHTREHRAWNVNHCSPDRVHRLQGKRHRNGETCKAAL